MKNLRFHLLFLILAVFALGLPLHAANIVIIIGGRRISHLGDPAGIRGEEDKVAVALPPGAASNEVLRGVTGGKLATPAPARPSQSHEAAQGGIHR
jgi:hypothetical protein